jgi:hypothetical protein
MHPKDYPYKQANLGAVTGPSFKDIATKYIEVHEPSWKNLDHTNQSKNTLRDYVYPRIGDTAISEVTVNHIHDLLMPIWATKASTAGKVRGRIELVLDYARFLNMREGPNPALWRGNLKYLLPAKDKVSKVVHHEAMPYQDIPAFVRLLQAKMQSTRPASSKGLLWVILMAKMQAHV